MKVIVNGLSNEEMSFLGQAYDSYMGEGVVEFVSYAFEGDLELVKLIRLELSDASILGVYLTPLADNPYLESCRGILESSGKFYEVFDTRGLVDYLNSKYDLNLEYVETISEESLPSVDDSLSSNSSSLLPLLEAKEDTIRQLQLQNKELADKYIMSLGSDEGLDFEITVDSPIDNSLVESLKSELDALKSSNSELNEKVRVLEADKRSLELDLANYRDLYSKESGYSRTLNGRIEELESQLNNSNSTSSDVERLQDRVNELESRLKSEQANVIELNRRLLSSSDSYEPSVEETSNSLHIPSSYGELVVGSLVRPDTQFRNVKFIFAGSGDSHREAYIRAERYLSESSNGGIFVDLSNESVSDYRFGVKRGIEVSSWYEDTLDSLRKYLSSTKYKDVYVLSSFKSSGNEMYFYSMNLSERLEYLESLGVNVIIYGGDISNYFGRDLLSSVSGRSSVEVVCRSLGTSARSMYYNSRFASGSSRAIFLLSGKVDEMSEKVAKIAKREGYDWRCLDA